MTPDSPGTLHIRCGSDIRQRLRDAGFIGEFLEFSDPYCQGPVPALPLQEFIPVRASFIADAYAQGYEESLARLKGQYAALHRSAEYDRIALWFEHDSYDQLILSFLLQHFSRRPIGPSIDLICVDAVPGVERFRGLGQLPPQSLRWLWEQAKVPVTGAHLSLGKNVWRATTETSPEPLLEIVNRGTQPIPFMARALKRHLQELPSSFNGLALTQQLILEILSAHGPSSCTDVFQRLTLERDPLPFLGDVMFWHVLSELQETREPLVATDKSGKDTSWEKRIVRITETGIEVLEGKRAFFSVWRGTRWIGGIRVKADEACWKWRGATRSVEYF